MRGWVHREEGCINVMLSQARVRYCLFRKQARPQGKEGEHIKVCVCVCLRGGGGGRGVERWSIAGTDWRSGEVSVTGSQRLPGSGQVTMVMNDRAEWHLAGLKDRRKGTQRHTNGQTRGHINTFMHIQYTELILKPKLFKVTVSNQKAFISILHFFPVKPALLTSWQSSSSLPLMVDFCFLARYGHQLRE